MDSRRLFCMKKSHKGIPCSFLLEFVDNLYRLVVEISLKKTFKSLAVSDFVTKVIYI